MISPLLLFLHPIQTASPSCTNNNGHPEVQEIRESRHILLDSSCLFAPLSILPRVIFQKEMWPSPLPHPFPSSLLLVWTDALACGRNFCQGLADRTIKYCWKIHIQCQCILEGSYNGTFILFCWILEMVLVSHCILLLNHSILRLNHRVRKPSSVDRILDVKKEKLSVVHGLFC